MPLGGCNFCTGPVPTVAADQRLQVALVLQLILELMIVHQLTVVDHLMVVDHLTRV